jgi:hypothetical protein
MELETWINRIEAAVDNRPLLEELREEIGQDKTLSDDDRQVLDGRIGTYLADMDEEGGFEPELEGADAGT